MTSQSASRSSKCLSSEETENPTAIHVCRAICVLRGLRLIFLVSHGGHGSQRCTSGSKSWDHGKVTSRSQGLSGEAWLSVSQCQKGSHFEPGMTYSDSNQPWASSSTFPAPSIDARSLSPKSPAWSQRGLSISPCHAVRVSLRYPNRQKVHGAWMSLPG